MKSNYEVRAQKFIKMLFPYIQYCKKPWQFVRACEAFVNDHPNRRVWCYSGISRVAIVTSDYVIKIDYNMNSDFGTCANEISMYDFVCKSGYERYFARISRYVYNGHEYYIMPRIRNIDPWNDDAQVVADDEDFVDFLNEHFFDLHSGNYGWKDGHIVIFDYAATA